EYDEEQLFTWQAAMRETKKAGKRMPTDEEFTELLKTKSDMPNIVLAGHRSTNGSFFNQGTCAYFWSSTESSTDAWFWLLSSSAATVSRSARSQASGFSIRCLKD
ncbi:MAG: FISUMP domain-containing protein, partial [Patescibacteria group bacterium]